MTEGALFQIFQEAIKSGIIDMDQTSQKVEEMNKKKILEQHPYAVFYREATGYWYTHLPDETKKEKRRRIRRKNKKDLEDAIVQFYTEKDEPKSNNLSTIRDIYPLWLDYLTTCSGAPTTVRRYDNDWHRWLERDPIVDKPIQTLDYLTLSAWAHGMVKGQNVINKPMTNKQYYNMATVIKGCMEHAVEKGIITDNVFLRVKIKKKLFYIPEKDFDDDRDQVFREDELPEIRELALQEYMEIRDEVALAVFAVSYTGLRAAEVCALRWKSLNDDMTEMRITSQIVKNEKRDKHGKWEKVEWIMVDHAKSNNGIRNVYIPTKLREALIEHKKYKKPQSDDEMIFARADGSFITNNQTYRRTVKYSEKINTYKKGTHKLRKTYLSVLYDGGIHESTLTKIAGHAVDGKVLHKSYLKDRKTKEEVRQKIEEVL